MRTFRGPKPVQLPELEKAMRPTLRHEDGGWRIFCAWCGEAPALIGSEIQAARSRFIHESIHEQHPGPLRHPWPKFMSE